MTSPARTFFLSALPFTDMRVVHQRDQGGESDPIATQVDLADSFFSQFKGLMFQRSLPDEYALVFQFDRAQRRSVHMLFVFEPLDVIWLKNDEVQRVETLSPWRGFASAGADTIIELPAGGASTVAAGDTVRIESGE